jgi:hypothetical protein
MDLAETGRRGVGWIYLALVQGVGWIYLALVKE